jgi:hypothetical protein
MKHIQGFTGSHWMPSLGKFSHHFAAAAAMVEKFIETTHNTNKTHLLASNYGAF